LREKQQHDGSDFFIGARLSARRQKLGIPIEKAAKDTRIPVARLRMIESDDFSSFSHPTYARLFLTDYANYLGVPIEDIREYLPGIKGLGSADNAYLNVLLSKPGFMQGEQFKSMRRLLFAVGTLIVLLLLVGAGIYAWRAWKKIERVQPVASTVEALPTPSAIPTPTPFVESTPTPEPEPTPEPTPEATPVKIQTSDAIRIQPPLTPAATPLAKTSITPIPKSKATPVASPTPLTSLPPFQPSSRRSTTNE
jgi:cytoskeletal protein RodZ